MRQLCSSLLRLFFLAVCGVLASASGTASAISYTVQVAALSDPQAAQELRLTLLEAGYPAYLVSVPGETQTVFRLRVGAFSDRDAAQAYAEAMRGVGGTVPVPALSEGIPPDLIPLEPKLLERFSYFPIFERFDVLPWPGGAALRVQGRFENEPFEARYRVLTPELVGAPFSAWRAAPAQGTASGTSVERVTNLSLLAEGETELGNWLSDGLGDYGEAQLLEAADALGLSPAQVRSYIFYHPGSGAPYLVVAERYDPLENSGGRYPALGNPLEAVTPPEGPELTWFGRAAPEGFPEALPEPLLELSELLTEEGLLEGGQGALAGSVQGRGWRALRDGVYTRLQVGKRSWRAVVGAPLWAGGDYLLVLEQGGPVLYEIAAPQRGGP